MAIAFQNMLKRFGLEGKILAVNTDNATSNDTQTTKFDELDNSFDKENQVRCFNHTLQLSAKALLKPFNTALSGKAADDDVSNIGKDLQDDGINELQELNEADRELMLEETAAVRTTVTKVRFAKQ